MHVLAFISLNDHSINQRRNVKYLPFCESENVPEVLNTEICKINNKTCNANLFAGQLWITNCVGTTLFPKLSEDNKKMWTLLMTDGC